MTAESPLEKLLSENADIIRQLNETDEYMPRLSEDALTILINKGVLSLEEFNEFARRKISHRMWLRERLGAIKEQIEEVSAEVGPASVG